MKSELILPAGDLYKAKFAFMYGADTCYGGLAKYSLRKAGVNFTFKTLKQAIELAHSLGKKFYITFNILARNYNLKNIEADIRKIAKAKPDAFIVSDPGVVQYIRKNSKIPIHLSTQANTTNWQSAKFWKEQGIKRIVLARELTLKEIKEINKKVPGIELEIFVHGAMCISYSGRCLLSAVMTGREANQGDCAQSCRWKYRIVKRHQSSGISKLENEHYLEEGLRPGEYYPIQEDREGVYIFNSKDLRLIRYLPEILKAGVVGLKIEGRNKSEYYIATVAKAYHEAQKLTKSKKYTEKHKKDLEYELEKLNYRGYTTGFLYNKAKKGETYPRRQPIRTWNFLGVILKYQKELALIEVRNQIKTGDKVEILTPQKIYKETVLEIYNENIKKIIKIDPGRKNQKCLIKMSKYPLNSLIRKKLG